MEIAFQCGDLLHTLETICKSVLRCPNARAYLLSDHVGMEPGQLVYLQSNSLHSISKFVKVRVALALVLCNALLSGVDDV